MLSQGLILSHVTAVLTNQNTRNFSNIIKYCEKSWDLTENYFHLKSKALLKITQKPFFYGHLAKNN